jgi:hypothetical protein
MSSKRPKRKPAPKPRRAVDDATRANRPGTIPFGGKADARSSPKEQKTWEEAEPQVLDDMTPG